MPSRKRVIALQLNELNFDYVDRYISLGYLPAFGRLFERYGYSTTRSETQYNLANPWIQWPTVHTGLDYAEHGIFRTGDCVHNDFPQLFDLLESHGFTVAAISPFNARNSTTRSPFFVPDPWTETEFSGSWTLRLLYHALVTVTDDYAKNRISPGAMVRLAAGLLRYAKKTTLPSYLRESLAYFRGKTWYRALVCDRLLVDAFLVEWRRHRPDYATLFLNGAAHLQHHYLFNSKAYDGERRNPEWIAPRDEDPLLDVLSLYDRLLERFIALDGVRLQLQSALSQVPHDRETRYYRIDDLPAFLGLIGLEHERTYPLMTEDFIVCFRDEETARRGQELLENVETVGEEVFYLETGDCEDRTDRTSPRVFHVENRGDNLYVQLKPTKAELYEGMRIRSGDRIIADFDRLASFAQYKNTNHVGVGYFLDTGFEKGELPADLRLTDTFRLVLDAFGIDGGKESPARTPRLDAAQSG